MVDGCDFHNLAAEGEPRVNIPTFRYGGGHDEPVQSHRAQRPASRPAEGGPI